VLPTGWLVSVMEILQAGELTGVLAEKGIPHKAAA
jgi:hypothetical protein